MAKVTRLTESDLVRLVKRIVKEQGEEGLTDTLSGTEFGELMKGVKGTFNVESDGTLILMVKDELFKII